MTVFNKSALLLLVACTLFVIASLISGCAGMYDGKKLFFSVGCSQCHSFKGRGGSLAPDLSAVTNIRSEDWIYRYIHDPKKINPQARMPAFKHLSGAKRKAIIAFLKT